MSRNTKAIMGYSEDATGEGLPWCRTCWN